MFHHFLVPNFLNLEDIDYRKDVQIDTMVAKNAVGLFLRNDASPFFDDFWNALCFSVGAIFASRSCICVSECVPKCAL